MEYCLRMSSLASRTSINMSEKDLIKYNWKGYSLKMFLCSTNWLKNRKKRNQNKHSDMCIVYEYWYQDIDSMNVYHRSRSMKICLKASNLTFPPLMISPAPKLYSNSCFKPSASSILSNLKTLRIYKNWSSSTSAWFWVSTFQKIKLAISELCKV